MQSDSGSAGTTPAAHDAPDVIAYNVAEFTSGQYMYSWCTITLNDYKEAYEYE